MARNWFNNQYSHNVNIGKKKIWGKINWKIDLDTCILVKGRKGFLDTFWPTRMDAKKQFILQMLFFISFSSAQVILLNVIMKN